MIMNQEKSNLSIQGEHRNFVQTSLIESLDNKFSLSLFSLWDATLYRD